MVHGIGPDFRRWYYEAHSAGKELEIDGLQVGWSTVGTQMK